jgi:hypothetical protein
MAPIFIEDKVFLDYTEYPKEFLSSWILFTTFDEKSSHGGICALYINDMYPKGTIVYSNTIMNETPAAYITWQKDGKFNRAYTSNKYRRMGIASSLGPLTRTLLYLKSGIFISYPNDPTAIADEVIAKALGKTLNEKDTDIVRKNPHWKPDWKMNPYSNKKIMDSSRDPVPPAYWYSESDYVNES